MATGYSTPITVTTSTANLYSVLRTAGYVGNNPIVGEITFVNLNTTPLYVHFTQSGATAPSTGTDGIPVGIDPATAPASSFQTRGIDLATTWVYAPSSISIKVAISGGHPNGI